MTSRPIETIESLVEKLRLSDVVYYEVAARLRPDRATSAGPDAPKAEPPAHEDDSGQAAGSQTGDEPLAEGEYETGFSFQTRHEGNEFGARLTVEVRAHHGDVIVDLACEYVSDDVLRIPREVAYEFINNVTLMQAFPYVREAVMTLTARVFRAPILLPVLLRGAIGFEPQGGPDISDGMEELGIK